MDSDTVTEQVTDRDRHMSQLDTDDGRIDQTNSHVPTDITYEDRIYVEDDTEYRVIRQYTAAGGTPHLKMRDDEGHNMFPSLHRVRQLIAEGDWRYRAR